ncbi:MAG: GNAT family N-acetyltransferase [Actinomycetota bacterium]
MRYHVRPLDPDHYPGLYRLELELSLSGEGRLEGTSLPFEDFIASLWSGVEAQAVVLDTSASQPVVGLISLYSFDARAQTAYLAAYFWPSFRGRYFVARTVFEFIGRVFEQWPLRKLYMEVSEDRLRSFPSLVGRLMRVEGRLSNHVFRRGAYQDLVILSLSREAWVESKYAKRFSARL